jgi:hypothetical protein
MPGLLAGEGAHSRPRHFALSIDARWLDLDLIVETLSCTTRELESIFRLNKIE